MLHTNVVIVGGGLAGLSCALQLIQQELEVVLVEKKEYPFHRVCGEYISNEVQPFLQRLGAYPSHLNPPKISRLHLTSTKGEQVYMQLPLGGFGISRYQFDHYLYQKAAALGVQFITRKYVESINFQGDQFEVVLNDQQKISSSVVIGAFGKRSVLDKMLNRPFMKIRSPYLAVKYHLKGDFPEDLIALHNFQGGYAGISSVEGQTLNLCYLAASESLKSYGNISSLEKQVLMKNVHLRRIFEDFDFLFEQPLVINEVSFEKKQPIEQHILMCGDAAGMITPLCGNGMAMAIHSSSLLAPLVLKFFNKAYYTRDMLEQDYTRVWNDHFKQRLWNGRQIQKLFGSDWMSLAAVKLCNSFPAAAQFLVRQTHGDTF